MTRNVEFNAIGPVWEEEAGLSFDIFIGRLLAEDENYLTVRKLPRCW